MHRKNVLTRKNVQRIERKYSLYTTANRKYKFMLFKALQ